MINSIEPSAVSRQRLAKLYPRPRVTIAIGLITEDKTPDKREIVFASDSQTTFQNGPKTFEGQKLNVVFFGNGAVMFAHSGSRDYAEKAIDLIQEKATGVKIESRESVSRVVELVLRQMFAEQRDHLGLDERTRHQFFADYPLSMLFGFYHNSEPYLYRIDWQNPVAVRSRDKYEAIGIGDYLATYLLSEYASADPGFAFGQLISISVIKTVIDHVKDCGGPIQFGIVFPKNEQESGKVSAGFILPKEHTEYVKHELLREEHTLDKARRNHMMKIVGNIWGGVDPSNGRREAEEKFKDGKEQGGQS